MAVPRRPTELQQRQDELQPSANAPLTDVRHLKQGRYTLGASTALHAEPATLGDGLEWLIRTLNLRYLAKRARNLHKQTRV